MNLMARYDTSDWTFKQFLHSLPKQSPEIQTHLWVMKLSHFNTSQPTSGSEKSTKEVSAVESNLDEDGLSCTGYEQHENQDIVGLESLEKEPLLNSCSPLLDHPAKIHSNQYNVEDKLFICCWNDCYHQEKSTDKIYHHILHSHLHRATDFRSTRCQWRGCSRDGIRRVFSSRHELLMHVGVHCQKLKETAVTMVCIGHFLCESEPDKLLDKLSV